MELYLLRHGPASQTSPDASRTLTPHGKTEVGSIGAHFKKNKLKIAEVWHSPKTRAVETASVFLATSGNSGAGREEKKALKPDGDAEEILRDLASFKGPSLLLVTHLPFVAELAHKLDPDGDGAQMTFPTAGLAAFERKGSGWKWLWSIDPSSLK